MPVGDKLGGYKITREAGERVLTINYEGSIYAPSLENNAFLMAQVVDHLINFPDITTVSILQKEEYAYGPDSTKYLKEIAEMVKRIKTKDVLSETNVGPPSVFKRCYPGRYETFRRIISHQIKSDPIRSHHDLKRLLAESKEAQKAPKDEECAKYEKLFSNSMNYVLSELSNTKMLKLTLPHLDKFPVGDRAIYTEVIRPSVRPSFIYTKLTTSYPPHAEEVDSYKVGDNAVLILKVPDDIRYIYHVTPPEFRIGAEKYRLLGAAREVIAEHKPTKAEFIDPKRTREIFKNIERDLIRDLARSEKITLTDDEIEQLSEILVRYTIGFGLVEVLLEDPKIQDVAVNAPAGLSPIFLIHADYGECVTNISVTLREVDSWATKLRLSSGRPLDEANPVLDTRLVLPKATARVSVTQQPFSHAGLAYSFRRHRDRAWTLPLFVQNRMITPLAAGLFSFLIDGARTMLVAGTRSSGKTSFLSSLLVEIMRTSRVLTLEDTRELPVDQLRELGYDVQSMKVRSVIAGGTEELAAEEGIRAALRMGDSSLIVGEVRSKEALALYEAMRVGALANVVAGTIHGASPYGVFDRVVNDLGVPKTSFKATDIIAVANPIISASGLEKKRRMISISEVRKTWEDDPLREGGFADLMTYNTQTDQLEPTPVLIEGESEIVKDIASKVREWAGDWDAVWANIRLRAEIKNAIVEAAEKLKNPELLEAPFVVKTNDQFHKFSHIISQELGAPDPKAVFDEWHSWLKKELKK